MWKTTNVKKISLDFCQQLELMIFDTLIFQRILFIYLASGENLFGVFPEFHFLSEANMEKTKEEDLNKAKEFFKESKDIPDEARSCFDYIEAISNITNIINEFGEQMKEKIRKMTDVIIILKL